MSNARPISANNIFVKTLDTLDTLVAILEKETNVKSKLVTNPSLHDDYYLFHDQRRGCFTFYDAPRWFFVHTHSLINDRDLNFEDYQYQIEVDVSGRRSRSEEGQRTYLERRSEYAYLIFDKLRALNLYQLMMVNEVYVKYEEFIPISMNEN